MDPRGLVSSAWRASASEEAVREGGLMAARVWLSRDTGNSWLRGRGSPYARRATGRGQPGVPVHPPLPGPGRWVRDHFDTSHHGVGRFARRTARCQGKPVRVRRCPATVGRHQLMLGRQAGAPALGLDSNIVRRGMRTGVRDVAPRAPSPRRSRGGSMSRTTLRPTLAALSLIIAVVAAVVLPAGAAERRGLPLLGLLPAAPAARGPSPPRARPGRPRRTAPSRAGASQWRRERPARTPRATATFDDTLRRPPPPRPGKKRVGVVIDYGRAADAEDGAAPPPRPASAPSSHRRHQRRGAGRGRRRAGEKGLVCAVDSHPATGCGGEVKEVSPAAKAADTPVASRQRPPPRAGARASGAAASEGQRARTPTP